MVGDRSASAAHFPAGEWETRLPEELGFDRDKLEAAWKRFREELLGADGQSRVCVVRRGYLAAEWTAGIGPEEQVNQASAAKSVFSSLLGIAVAEGRIPSADAVVSAYYPEMLEVPEGRGPKPGRHNKAEDAQITFRHLISNTSGYLKPGERPGECFHYQTYGMNVLMHALGRVYGVYDSNDPEGSVGPGELIRSKIRDPIGGTWPWYWGNFAVHAEAKLGVFGYYTGLLMTCRDQARLGWLWRHAGAWAGRQVVPAEWIRAATTSTAITRNASPDEPIDGVGVYGRGFWTNDRGKLWPALPRDSFAASGAGSQLIWVCPSLDLVIAQSPGAPGQQQQRESRLLEWIVGALAD
jgi:CubicO group peptidase (beta-lactamase class C family)